MSSDHWSREKMAAAIVTLDTIKNIPLVEPEAMFFKCQCDNRVKLQPSHYMFDRTLKEHVQDVVCQECRGTYKDLVRVVCAQCRFVVSTFKPTYDGKLGYEFKAGSVLHVPVCATCLPGIETITPTAKVPIIELLIHTCMKEGKNHNQEIQLWWTTLLSQLPPSTAASISKTYSSWRTTRSKGPVV